MKKMDRSDARKIVDEGVDIFLKEMEKGKHPIEVGKGDIKTKKDQVKIRQAIEVSLWREIRSQYDLGDC